MTVHLCIRAGNWMFLNRRLYRLRQVTSVNGKIKRMAWKCIGSGKEPHNRGG